MDNCNCCEKILERIAVALEKIAGVEQSKGETPFPWLEASAKLRPWRLGRGFRTSVIDEKRFAVRPDTCEGLIRVGRSRLMDGLLRCVGERTVETIDPIMERLGFGDQWMSS